MARSRELEAASAEIQELCSKIPHGTLPPKDAIDQILEAHIGKKEHEITVTVGFGMGGINKLEGLFGLNAMNPAIETATDAALHQLAKGMIDRGAPKDKVIQVMEAHCLEDTWLDSLKAYEPPAKDSE